MSEPVKKESPYWKSSAVEKSKSLLESVGISLFEDPSETGFTKDREKLFRFFFESHEEKYGRDNATKSFRGRSYKIYLTEEQKTILLGWFDDARLLYNVTVNMLSSTQEKSDPEAIRNTIVTKKNTKVTDPKLLASMKRTPKDVRAGAVFEACTAHDVMIQEVNNPKHTKCKKALRKAESDLKKLKKNSPRIAIIKKNIELLTDELKNIPEKRNRGLKLNKRCRRSKFAHVVIPKSACTITKDGIWKIYPSYDFGEIQMPKKTIGVKDTLHPECDFKIRWNRRTNDFHIIVSEKIILPALVKSYRTVVCDPGIRTVGTVVDSSGNLFEIGNEYLDNINRREENCKVKGKRGKKRYNAYRASLNFRQNDRKLRNIVDEMHKKITIELLKDYDIIVFPKLYTKGFLNAEGGLGKEINKRISLLAHCKFHDYLTWKAKTLGKIVIDQDESFTTKTCFDCGYLNDIGGAPVYTCKYCKNTCGRDTQSAFNILTRYASSYSSTRV